jgi:hypothetical protein
MVADSIQFKNTAAKLDKKPDSQAKSNTEMLFNKQLDNLFNTQEEMKIVKEQKNERNRKCKNNKIDLYITG